MYTCICPHITRSAVFNSESNREFAPRTTPIITTSISAKWWHANICISWSFLRRSIMAHPATLNRPFRTVRHNKHRAFIWRDITDTNTDYFVTFESPNRAIAVHQLLSYSELLRTAYFRILACKRGNHHARCSRKWSFSTRRPFPAVFFVIYSIVCKTNHDQNTGP